MIVGVAGVLVGAAGVIAGNVIWRRVLLALGGGAVVLALTIIVLDDPEQILSVHSLSRQRPVER